MDSIEDNVINLGDEPVEEIELQPEWANAPSVEDLKTDLMEAQGDHDSATTKVDGYLDKMYIQNGEKLPKSKTHSTLQPKVIRTHAEWRKPALSEPFLSTPDIFNVDPKGPQDVDAAKQHQAILNYQFNHQLDKQKLVDDYVATATEEGTVILRIGWDYEEEMEQVQMMDPMMGTIVVVEQPKVIKNQPSVEVCSYQNVVFDPTCEGCLEKAEFVIYSFETSLSDLEKAGSYQNLDMIEVSNAEAELTDDDSHFHADEDRESFSFTDKPRKKLQAYEYWGYWDINDDGITKPIVATWVNNVMVRLEENPFPFQKHPFVVAQYLPVRRSLRGEPDGILIEDNQKVIGATMRGIVDTMARSAVGQKGYQKGALDLTNKRKFDRGEDYEFNPGTIPGQAFHDHTYPELPQSSTLLLQMMQQDAENLTGVRPYGNTETDLTKARSMGSRGPMDAASKRENAILRRLAQGFEKMGRMILSMNAAWLTPQDTMRISEMEFIQPDPENLDGSFDLRISVSTAESDNEKASELAFMLQTMGNTMPPDFSQIILSEIATLRKMPQLASKIAAYEPPPPSPQEQMMQQMQMMMQQIQIQQMQMDVKKTQTEAQENMADYELKTAKAGTEYVRQDLAQSDRDQKDLDFVEQQTGIKHARDVDKITAQAKAQGETKILEAGLKELNEENALHRDTRNR